MAYLVVGLGNPGKEYSGTRHNFGFFVVDKLINISKAEPRSTKAQAKVWGWLKEDHPFFTLDYLLEPETFMNLSGNAVHQFMREKKISTANLVVVHDDLDIPFGDIRVSRNATAAGHNGVQSVIDALGTKDFNRVRIGIGRPTNNQAVEDYVLARFSSEEKKQLPEIVDKSIQEIEKIFLK